ncbi:hypothetical protein LHJ74_19970 [Streptomyces sp. N2-109]|uniref:Secreted protein n=1 Tax=Streptomyces gossypii TaxID=2883101 RepID=A0ABT2JW65_9ACTN|nr:hypothetical protein [Streptomyces gossypii]MCT2592153.1 hypothetical protein [Streptomyces gossypii]
MLPQQPEDRLARLRGPASPEPYTARKITALTANPACARRAVLDAAGVDKALLATRIGFEPRFGQSPFALTRGQAFETLVAWGGYAELVSLLRTELAVPVTEAAVADLTEVAGNSAPAVRARETQRLLERIAAGDEDRLILGHPMLTLDVAGRTAFLEPDALTHRIGGRFYAVEIRSFPAIDGQADPARTAEAVKQAAVHVIALRQAFHRAGLPPEAVADEFLLICPKDFSNRPYGRLLDLRQELDAVEFQLGRLRRAADLTETLPADASFDLAEDSAGSPVRDAGELDASVGALEAAYSPSCLSFCEMSRYCRQEAETAGEPARLGSGVRNDLPGIGSTRTALGLIDGTVEPEPEQAEIAELLRTAARLRDLRGGGAA